jgi:hypothetical protein
LIRPLGSSYWQGIVKARSGMRETSIKLFTIGALLQILVAVGHVIGHFAMPRPANETEEKLVRMMSSYEKKVAGGKMSILESYDGLNISYGLFFLFAGVTNFFIRRKHKTLIKPLSFLNASTMAIGCVVSIVYFFWIPVVYFSLTSSFFLAAIFTHPVAYESKKPEDNKPKAFS